jgi:AhpD family alkylhydroperoxidase
VKEEEIQNVEKDFKITLGVMRKEVPEATEAFLNLLRSVHRGGAVSIKEKELISLGISLYARCESCIILHTKSALEAGATKEELMETCGVAVMMGGSPIVSYVSTLLKAFEKFSQKTGSPQ